MRSRIQYGLMITMSEHDDFDEFDEPEEEGREPFSTIQEKTPQSKRPQGSRISLFFRSTIGPREKLEKLSIDPEMSVKELSSTLGDIFGLDPQEFHLSISGRTMDNDDVLSNYELEDGIEVLIIPVSTAG